MKRQCYRSVKKHEILVGDPSGGIREIKPTDTLWYMLYIESSPKRVIDYARFSGDDFDCLIIHV